MQSFFKVMVPPTYCLADLAEQDLDPVKFETILSSANTDKKLKKQIEGVDSHRASAIMRKLRHATRASKGGLSCSSKQYVQVNPAVQSVQGQDVKSALLCRAVLAVRLTGTLVTSKSFVSKLQCEWTQIEQCLRLIKFHDTAPDFKNDRLVSQQGCL